MVASAPAAIDISVIIPTHNRSDALNLTLERLSKQDFDGIWELVVVNNNCTDNTDGIVRTWQERFPIELKLVHESKPGPAAARNTGARAAEGEYLLFIDNDILTEKDFISRHYRRLREASGCWVVNEIRNLPEQETTVFGRYKQTLFPPTTNHKLTAATNFTGAGASLPRKDLERLGGFDEDFFVASGEDRELAMRAIGGGISILYDPTIVTLHNDWAGTSIRDYCRRQRVYTQTEPLFAIKYGDQNPRVEMWLRNSPLNLSGDGVALTVDKLGKSAAGSRAGQAVLISACELLERVAPDSRLLWSLYRIAIAGAIYKGYQEGLAKLNGRAAE